MARKKTNPTAIEGVVEKTAPINSEVGIKDKDNIENDVIEIKKDVKAITVVEQLNDDD